MNDMHQPEGLPRESLLRILEVSQKLAESFDPIELLTEVVEAGKEVLLAERGSLWIYRAEHADLQLMAQGD